VGVATKMAFSAFHTSLIKDHGRKFCAIYLCESYFRPTYVYLIFSLRYLTKRFQYKVFYFASLVKILGWKSNF